MAIDQQSIEFRKQLLRAAHLSGYEDTREVLAREPQFHAAFPFLGPEEHIERILVCHDTSVTHPDYSVIGTLEHVIRAGVDEAPLFKPAVYYVRAQEWWRFTSVGLVPGKRTADVQLIAGFTGFGGHYKGANPEAAARFVAFVRDRIAEGRTKASGTPLLGDLERLASLRASGALTEEEFALAKRRLLES
jgi:hypothetical protein